MDKSGFDEFLYFYILKNKTSSVEIVITIINILRLYNFNDTDCVGKLVVSRQSKTIFIKIIEITFCI